jgi:hypothetical protein
MFRSWVNLIYVSSFTLGLSACAVVTEQQLLVTGATRLNGAQAQAHLEGKTESWPYYETYYSTDGKVQVVWNKIKSKGTWEVSAAGKVCVSVPIWERSPCHSYLDNHGKITRIEEGISVGVKEIENGRKLSR